MKKILRALFSLLAIFGFATVAVACGEPEEPTQGEQQTQDVELTAKLAANDEGVYTVTAENGTAEIACTKSVGMGWSALIAAVENAAGKQSLRFTVKGDCKILVKIESAAGNKQVELELEANPKAYEWDLSPAEEQAILAGANFKVLIFALPGLEEGSGSLTISNFVLSTEEAMFNPINSGYTNVPEIVVPETPLGKEEFVYDGTSETFNINRNWSKLDEDQETYTFTEVENGVEVSYNLSNWQFAKSAFYGDYRKFTHVTIKVTGTAGEKLLVKVEGNGRSFAKEERFVFNGEEQILTLDISDVKESLRASGYCVLLCGNDGQGGQGTFTIHELYLGTEDETDLGEPVFVRPNPEVYWTGETFSPLNGAWYCGGQPWGDWHSEGTDKFTWNAETKTVSFADRTGYDWHVFGVDVRGNFANFSKLTYKFTATEGLKIKFLVLYGNKQSKELQEVVATGAEQTVELDLSVLTADERSSIQRIGFFTGYQLNSADADYTPAGEVKLHAVEFGGYATTTKTGADTFECKYFFDYRGPVQNYSIYRADNKTVVNFDKQSGSEWEGMVCFLDGNLAGYTTLNYDVELSEGAFITIKIEGSKHLELKLDGDATVKATGSGSIDLTKIDGMSEALAGAQKVVVFINLGQTNVNGTVTINSLTFTK